MRILSLNYPIRADIQHVFYCHQSLDFARDVLQEYDEFKGVEAQIEDEELILRTRNAQINVKVIESTEHSYLKFKLSPMTKNHEWLGPAVIDCNFKEAGESTLVNVEIASDKNPGFLVSLFIKTFASILKFQSRKYERTYVRAIEQSA